MNIICEIRGNLPWSLNKVRGSLEGAVSTIFRLENSRRIVMAPKIMFVPPRPAAAVLVVGSIWAIAVEVVEKQLQENGRKSGDTYRWMIATMIIGRCRILQLTRINALHYGGFLGQLPRIFLPFPALVSTIPKSNCNPL